MFDWLKKGFAIFIAGPFVGGLKYLLSPYCMITGSIAMLGLYTLLPGVTLGACFILGAAIHGITAVLETFIIFKTNQRKFEQQKTRDPFKNYLIYEKLREESLRGSIPQAFEVYFSTASMVAGESPQTPPQLKLFSRETVRKYTEYPSGLPHIKEPPRSNPHFDTPSKTIYTTPSSRTRRSG